MITKFIVFTKVSGQKQVWAIFATEAEAQAERLEKIKKEGRRYFVEPVKVH